MNATLWTDSHHARCTFVGGSEARTIMGDDEGALLRLWREKRGEHRTGRYRRPTMGAAPLQWMAATLDGRVAGSGAVFEAKFMLPWSFSEGAAAEKYMPQL